MRRLTVKNFSVIKDATLDFGGINVIIGPQASGKSLLCRLAYFFLDIVSIAPEALSDDTTLKAFRQQVRDSFIAWFPVNAWGKKKFEISYTHASLNISIVRTSRSGSLGEKIWLSLGQEFSTAYEGALQDIQAFNARPKKDEEEEEGGYGLWSTREIASRRLSTLFEKGQTPLQTYIPAGRAFFTTYSKAITAFESGSLDPITSRFGRTIERIFNDNLFLSSGEEELAVTFDEMRARILKGSIKNKRGILSFVADDGRTLSLTHLSSGTQEVLPLLASLRFTLRSRASRTVFAEEPEAHLFPSAQVDIVRLVSWLANVRRQKSCWVITTHSPYILTAFNNLIEAGQAARINSKLRDEVAKIIPEHFWIKEGDFKAYAIEDGKLKSILNESGFVEGNYLDQISEVIGNEFDELLGLEYDHTKAS
jgi:hypothetical protein